MLQYRMGMNSTAVRCFLILLVFFILPSSGSEIRILFTPVVNNTGDSTLNTLGAMLFGHFTENRGVYLWLAEDESVVDSFPSEHLLDKARSANAGYIIWGCFDTMNTDNFLRVHIFEMSSGIVNNIEIGIQKNQNRIILADILLSKITLALKRSMMSHLIITSNPKGAELYIDSVFVGTTPYEELVDPGSYTINVRKEAYEHFWQKASFLRNNTYQYHIPLKSRTAVVEDNGMRRWLVATVLLSAGTAASFIMRQRSFDRYRYATPPGNFDALFRNAMGFNIASYCFAGVTTVSLSITIVKVFRKPVVQ
ncbi:MAG: PEGA domain-containing protein [Chitinispirillaceae bacterium]|nr:PEGA domain-containing protein [Chitinispirillaceae bacterium]